MKQGSSGTAKASKRPRGRRVPREALEPLAQLEEIERAGGEGTLDLGRGASLHVSSLDKVFFPDRGLTKGDVMRYYAGVAPALLPLLKDRPLILKRFPNGIAGHSFFQQNAGAHPDGVRVAYVSVESGSGQIWVANSDGSGARQLTKNTSTNFWPFWSPDGQWVAFTSMRPNPVDIWKVPASGGTPVQVTHSNGFRGDWSPDGDRIAYDTQVLQGGPREREQGPSGIEIAEASTGKILRKVPAPNLQSPVWSRDGKRLTATFGNSVWIIDPDTGERHAAVQFPQDFNTIFRAAWAPDGKSVIVNRQQRVSQIVLMENFWAP